MSKVSIIELLTKGRWAQQVEHEAAEIPKQGTLRAGNSGILLADGSTIGKCPRLSLLRALGINYQVALNKNLMFAFGLANEDIVVAELKKAWEGQIKRESEIPVRWVISSWPEGKDQIDTVVTGRPDIVLCDAQGNPQQGIECKAPSSFWTAVQVHLKRVPKSDHLIQAAHYSWKLDIPFTLLYTSRVNWAMQGFSQPSKKPWKTWRHVQYEEYHDRRTGAPAVRTINLLPFDAAYELTWEGGALLIKHEQDKVWTKTLVTQQGIFEYYCYLSSCMIDKKVPCRPSSKNVFGEKEYEPCQPKYCEFCQVCDKADSEGYDCWLDHARTLTKDRGIELADSISNYLDKQNAGRQIEEDLNPASTDAQTKET